jgi:hypothetical protein
MAGLTDRQESFCSNFVTNGSEGAQAARDAGFSGDGRVDAHRLVKLPHIQARIFELTRQKMSGYGPKMLKVLMDLATSARSEKVRFDAAKDLMDRVGFKPVERILSVTQDTSGLSPDELRAKATKLLNDIFQDGSQAVVDRLNAHGETQVQEEGGGLPPVEPPQGGEHPNVHLPSKSRGVPGLE